MPTRLWGLEYAYGKLEPFDHTLNEKSLTGSLVNLTPDHRLVVVGFDKPKHAEVRITTGLGTEHKRTISRYIRHIGIWTEPFTGKNLFRKRAFVIIIHQ